ncbi:MAG: hypothetical protein ACO1QB_10405 [Verrucomicrobiales bacterium]
MRTPLNIFTLLDKLCFIREAGRMIIFPKALARYGAWCLCVCLFLLASETAIADATNKFKINIFPSVGTRIDEKTSKDIYHDVLQILKSSNFDTVNSKSAMSRKVADIHESYRKAAANRYLLVDFEQAHSIETVGGKVACLQIFIGIKDSSSNGLSVAGPLFTINPDGRVVEHGKYSGQLCVEMMKTLKAKELLK